MSQKLNIAIAVIGIDIGKNSFHVVGHDERGAIVLRRGQVAARFANMPPRLIGMEACVGRHQRHRNRLRPIPARAGSGGGFEGEHGYILARNAA